MDFYFPQKLRTTVLSPEGDARANTPKDTRYPKREYTTHDEDRVLDALRKDPADGFVLIIGEPGAGKTTLLETWLRRWTASLTSSGFWERVPVLVKLRECPTTALAARINGDGEALGDYFWDCGVNTMGTILSESSDSLPLHAIYKESREHIYEPVWFLDGLDEVASAISGTEAFFNCLKHLPGLKVVSCRAAAFGDFFRKQIAAPSNKTYDLPPLSPAERLAFLKKFFSEDEGRAEKLHKKLMANEQISGLSSIPLILRLIAEMEETGPALQLPVNRAEFYEKAVARVWNKKLTIENPSLEMRLARDHFLTALAAETKLDHFEIPLRLFDKVRVGLDASLETLLNKSGLLQFSKNTDACRYLHRTFQEYYLARAWLSENKWRAEFKNHWKDLEARYEEVFSLVICMLESEGRLSEADSALLELTRWGEEIHRNNPSILYRIKISPLRVVLRIVKGSFITIDKFEKLNIFLKHKFSPEFTLLISACSDLIYKPWRTAPLPEYDIMFFLDHLSDIDDMRQCMSGAILEGCPKIAVHGEGSVCLGIVNEHDLPEALHKQANAREPYERLSVANNPNTLPETLGKLVGDNDAVVRLSAANNPNTLLEDLYGRTPVCAEKGMPMEVVA